MKKLNDYFGLVCFLCVIIVGAISYKADIAHKEKIEKITIYYEHELNACDSVNNANQLFIQHDSIWHEAYKKIIR